MDTGGSIARSHDGGEDPLCLRDSPRPRIGYLNVLLSNPPVATRLFVEAVLGLVSDALLLASMLGRVGSVERSPQADAERIFLVSELVNEIACVAPKREVGVGFGGVEGGAWAVLVVVLEEISGISVSIVTCRRREGVEWDVGWPPVAG